ncbi:MAG: 2Fe-2S iron-sulfur cluster-binding protein [Bradymonadia bacterium]
MTDRSVLTTAHVGTRISQVIQSMELPLGYSCGGRGACLACLVSVSGEVAPLSSKEQILLEGMDSRDNWQLRLSCLARIKGPVKIKTTYW